MKRLVVALLLPTWISAAQSARTPTVYTVSITVDSGPGKVAVTSIKMRTNGYVERLDMEQGPGALAGMDGFYSLTFPKADSMVSVMPSQHMTVVANSPTEMMRTLGGVKMHVIEASSQAEDLGAGPVMFGLSTRRYRMKTHTIIEASIGDAPPCRKATDTVFDATIAPGYGNPESMSMTGALGSSGLQFADSTSEKLIKMRRDTPAGLLLRGESVTGGVKMITEVKDLSFDPQDPALFTTPIDYKVQDTRQMMKDNAAAMAPMIQQGFRKNFCGP